MYRPASETVGAVFGLTPAKYQPGENDRTGAISRCGDDEFAVLTIYFGLRLPTARKTPIHGRMPMPSSRRLARSPEWLGVRSSNVDLTALGRFVEHHSPGAMRLFMPRS